MAQFWKVSMGQLRKQSLRKFPEESVENFRKKILTRLLALISVTVHEGISDAIQGKLSKKIQKNTYGEIHRRF